MKQLLAPEELIQLESTDIDDNGNVLDSNSTLLLNKISGTLKHKLILAKGCKIIFIKNIDVNSGIVNGIDATFLDFGKNIMSIKFHHTIIPISKINQKITSKHYKVNNLYRYQFPILPQYGTTVHRVQGATLPRVRLYLDNTIFNDWQVYVALTRVNNFEDIHILNFDKSAFKPNYDIVDFLDYAEKNKTMKGFKTNKRFKTLHSFKMNVF